MKAKLRHARDAGRKRDEGAHHWKQTTKQDSDGAVLLEELRHAVEIVMAHEHPAAIALNQRTPARGSYPVSKDGTHVAANGAGGGDPEQAEAARVDEVPGEGHDDFAGKRDAGGLDAHQCNDACVSQG